MGDDRVLRPVPAWAHRYGLIAVAAPKGTAAPAAVGSQLQERLHWYCWGFDERREDVLADCFTTDAVWQASVMGETRVGPFIGRDAVLTWLTAFWPHQRDQRRHLVVNFVVDELDETGRPGPTAVALAYLLLLGSSDASTRLESTGLYRVGYRREAGRWLVASLTAGFDSPYWQQEVTTMSPRKRRMFGILEDH